VSLVSDLRRALVTALEQEATLLAVKNGSRRAEDYAAHAEGVGRFKGLSEARDIVLKELERFEVDEDG
jgi:hypothetical protein